MTKPVVSACHLTRQSYPNPITVHWLLPQQNCLLRRESSTKYWRLLLINLKPTTQEVHAVWLLLKEGFTKYFYCFIEGLLGIIHVANLGIFRPLNQAFCLEGSSLGSFTAQWFLQKKRYILQNPPFQQKRQSKHGSTEGNSLRCFKSDNSFFTRN